MSAHTHEDGGKPRSPRMIVQYLTRFAHGSAPFLSTFMMIHLSAPVLASLGGSSLASQVMILGREYYQTTFGHRYLLILPLVAHTASGIARRVCAPRTARRLSSLFVVTGYTTLLFFLPVHYLVHRIYPANPAPPIYSLGPAELDFEYVKYGLHAWPWRSWLLYTGLVAGVAWHATEGLQIIWNTYLRGRLGGWRASAQAHAANTLAIVVPVLAGLFVLSREPLMTFSSAVPRFEAAFRSSRVFRI